MSHQRYKVHEDEVATTREGTVMQRMLAVLAAAIVVGIVMVAFAGNLSDSLLLTALLVFVLATRHAEKQVSEQQILIGRLLKRLVNQEKVIGQMAHQDPWPPRSQGEMHE